MKLFKKVAVLGIAACLAIGVAALTACDDKSSGELTDAQWTERLTVNIDSIKSGTFKQNMYSTYSKAQAAEYGQWGTATTTTTIDLVNESVHMVSESEAYYAEDNTFRTEKSEYYLFRYNNAYYSWSKNYSTDSEPQGEVDKTTKSEFINETEQIANAFSAVTIYAQPQFRSAFKYDKDTQSYILAQYGTVSMSLKFLDDGGVRLTEAMSSIQKYDLEYSNIDKTVVTVPTAVKADVDAFIAEQQQ